jgi:hypothetical protein
MLTLLPKKGAQTQLLKFLIKDFFHFPPVSTMPVVHLELQIFEKNCNGLNGTFRSLGEPDT